MKRVLYVQYTNPAGYPPLQHSSRLLADKGWDVLFLGTGAHGAKALEFPPHPRITVRRMAFCPGGWRQKLHYIRFGLWALLWVCRWRPKWVYASDPLSCPVALLAGCLPGVRVAYHEHDSPVTRPHSPFLSFIHSARRKLAKRAQLCVLPNTGRADQFRRNTETARPVIAVWNCPSTSEVNGKASRTMTSELHLYYHGNLSPRLLPLALIEAMAKARCRVRLTAIGYKTISNENYDRTIADRASTLGIADRVTILPAIPRADLLGRAREFDVGWAVLPVDEQDVNFRYMVGASNKAFDYLACGLALLVTNDPQWKSTFVDQGYGLSCNPEDPDSIAEALTWFCGHREQMRKMGEMGRSRVLEQWNYETQFAPVCDLMDAAVAQST